MGAADEPGEVALAAFGVFSDEDVSFALAADVLLVPFFFAVGSFFTVDFFLADLDFADGLGDFFGLGEVDGSGFSVDFGVVSSLSVFFFFVDFACGEDLGDFFGEGELPGSGVSLGFAFAFGVDDGLALLFGFFAFGLAVGDGVGDESTARALRNCSRLRASSSVFCARMSVPTIALIARAMVIQMRKRATAAERNRPGDVFKRPASRQLRSTPSCLPVRDAKSRSTCRPRAGENRSDTST